MAVVLSGGQLVQVGGPVARPARSLTLYGLRQSYAQIFATQPAVQTVVKFIARNIAQLQLHAFERTADDDRIRLRTGPVAQVVRKPNPVMVGYRFRFGLVADLGIYDEHTSLKTRDANGDLRLWPLPVEMVEPKGGNWIQPEYYRIGGTSGFDATPAQVFRVVGYHPNSLTVGCPPLEALRRVLAGDEAAEQYREAFWRNGAQVGGVIKRPADAPKWATGTKEKFAEQWQARYAALTGAGAGGTPILEDGMEYQQIGSTLRDSQWLEGRQATLTEAAHLYFIPPPMIGVLDKANYSSTTEFHKLLYADTLGPTITHIEEEFNDQVVAEVADPATTYVELNWLEKLAASFEEQAAVLSTATGRPWMTGNEARARMNLPRDNDDPTMDQVIIPLNVIAGGQPSPQTPTDVPKALPAFVAPAELPPAGGTKARRPRPVRTATSADHVDLMAKTLSTTWERQAGVVLAKLGAAKAAGTKAAAADLFDRDRFDRELAADLHTTGLTLAEETAADVLVRAGKDGADATAEPMSAYLRAKAKAQAEALNDTTERELDAALDAEDDPATAVKGVFDGRLGLAADVALGLAAAVVGFAAQDTAKSIGYGTKTWIVTSAKSRHPELDGETVPIDDTFSNGARWPGDSDAGVDEAAGCSCDMELTYGGTD